MKPAFAPFWWAATALTLVGLILAPLRLVAFCELLAASGAAFGLLYALGRHRIRRRLHLRWFAVLATAVTIAATATSVVWATPAVSAPLAAAAQTSGR